MRLLFATCILFSATIAEAQEIQGPHQNTIDVWTGCCQNEMRFDSDNRNERERGNRTDEDVVYEDVRERLLRESPTFCVATPIPIDNYYIGCVVRFEPQPATVDV